MKDIHFSPGAPTAVFLQPWGDFKCTSKRKEATYTSLSRAWSLVLVEKCCPGLATVPARATPTAAEQGDTREAEGWWPPGGVGDSAQTLDAAFKAAWTQGRENTAGKGKNAYDFMKTTH